MQHHFVAVEEHVLIVSYLFSISYNKVTRTHPCGTLARTVAGHLRHGTAPEATLMAVAYAACSSKGVAEPR